MCPFPAVANLEPVTLSKFKEMLKRDFRVFAAVIDQPIMFEVVKVFRSPAVPVMDVRAQGTEPFASDPVVCLR